jgi:DNA-binding MarR family transcriptional regulator
MNKKDIERIGGAIVAMRANGFTSLEEAWLFFTAAAAQLNGGTLDVSGLRDGTGIPMSTASRILWTLHERGLLSYQPDAGDRRRKLIHVNLEALK